MPLNAPQIPEFDPNDARLAKPTIDFELHAVPQAIATLEQMGFEGDADAEINARAAEVKAKAKELGEAAYGGADNIGEVAIPLAEAGEALREWLQEEVIDAPA